MTSGLINEAALPRSERAAQRIAALARASESGARLGTKNELRELCGVSVGTFNEALRLLQSRGIVAVRPGPGGGLFVAEQPPMVRLGNSVLALDAEAGTVADAVRIRDALDPLLIRDAVAHSSPAALAGYREQVALMATAVEELDGVAFLRANWRLHALIAEVNPSALLRSIYLSLLEVVEAHLIAVLPHGAAPMAEVMAARCRVHADLVEAIAAGDRAEVDRLIEVHRVKSGLVASP
ncbi:FadR/GntR family transcriptional regulator [Pseudonocardia sp. GCM10023141]|uniref:FadR/GntR family transcriptional regulator n=1 Tax=Pseudonocardia sp. GCM10023141 TaxID=3252653 RepID=UPI0036206346